MLRGAIQCVHDLLAVLHEEQWCHANEAAEGDTESTGAQLSEPCHSQSILLTRQARRMQSDSNEKSFNALPKPHA